MSREAFPLERLGIDPFNLADAADRRFRRLALAILIPFLILAILLPLLNLSGLKRGGGETLDKRFVSLLPDAQVAEEVEEPKPAEEEKPEAKPEEPAPKPTPTKEPAKAPTPPQPTQEELVQNARQKAAKSGVMAMADQLAALRDDSLKGFDSARPLAQDSGAAVSGLSSAGGASGGAIERAATASSGGISGAGTGETRRTQAGAGLGQRRTTTVENPVGAGKDKTKPGQDGNKPLASRNPQELQQVFDRNAAAFYAITARAQRDNPNLGGKMVVSLTIAPDGSVTKCELVSSDLGDAEVERKVIARIMLLNFGAKNVPPFTYPNYPIRLFPQ